MNRSTIVATRGMAGRDFEDNIQIASAVEVGADVIVTRDPADFANSPVRVMSPADVLAVLAPQP